nr:hypothetical protein [Tanacetum cinerariifolium]
MQSLIFQKVFFHTNDAIALKIARYKVYQSKKKKSKEDNAEEESEEQNVSRVGRRRDEAVLLTKSFNTKERRRQQQGIMTELVIEKEVYTEVEEAFKETQRFKLLMQGTELSQQELECKLYNEFDRFTLVKGRMAYGKAMHSAKEDKELCMVQVEKSTSLGIRIWSDNDEAPGAKGVLIANLFSYDLVVIFEIPIS